MYSNALSVCLYCRRMNVSANKIMVEQIEVKVKENWRQDEGLLKNYGYEGRIQAL